MLDLSKFSHSLQEFYDNGKIFDVCARSHPFLALLMDQKKKVSGEVYVYSLVTAPPAGRSASFASALANAEGSSGVKFKVDTVQSYQVVHISSNVLDASEGQSAAAFFDARVLEINKGLKNLSSGLAHSFWRSGSGSLGRVVSTQSGSSTTITLANPRDAKFFEVGMKIVADSTDGTGTVGTTESFVKAVDMEAGTLMVSASIGGAAIDATASDLAANQYIFQVGDFGAKIKGVMAWCPASVASNDSFYGVNRSANRYRLAGLYRDCTNLPIEESIIDAAATLADWSDAEPELCFMSSKDWGDLNKSLSSKVQYVDMKPNAEASFAFKGIIINGPKGPITCVSDSDIPDGYALITQPDAWEAPYMGKDLVFLENYYGGGTSLQISNASGIEIRMKSNCALACKAPAFNAVLKLR